MAGGAARTLPGKTMGESGSLHVGPAERPGSDPGTQRWSAVARLTHLFEEEEEDDGEELYDDGEDYGDFHFTFVCRALRGSAVSYCTCCTVLYS